jgi:hypothetical protein
MRVHGVGDVSCWLPPWMPDSVESSNVCRVSLFNDKRFASFFPMIVSPCLRAKAVGVPDAERSATPSYERLGESHG